MNRDVDFLFEYEVRNRELDPICLIGAYLRSKGYSVGYVNSWESVFKDVKRYNAKVLIVSACYRDDVYDYFGNHALSFDKVVNMQWEQVLSNWTVYGNGASSWNYSGTALETKHVCWGTKEADNMRSRFGIDDRFLGVCGYTPLDFYRPEFRCLSEDRESLFARYGLDPNKRTFLFASTFSYIGLPKSEEAKGNSDEKEVLKKIQADAQRIIMDWFIKYATDHPEVQIIYRPHPTEASNEAIKQRIDPVDNLFLIPQESIRVWMLNCDLLLNFQSTSMIEMYASGKQVRLLRPVEVPFLFEMPIFEEGKYTAITTYEAFAKSVSEEDAAFPIEAEHLLSYYDINDCPSYQRVGDFLIETLNDDSYHSRPVAKPSSDLRRFFGSRKMQMLASISESRYNRISAKENVDWEADAKAMKIKEDYVHYNYFRQKMDQNSATDDEIQTKLKRYEEIMRKGRNE